MRRVVPSTWGLLLLLTAAAAAPAQQVDIGTPLQGGGSGFFEHFGVGFGFEHVTPNSWMFFQHGGGLQAWPPFGGFHPNQAGTIAVGGRSGDFRWNLQLSAVQGSSYNSTTTTPLWTVPNGGWGFANDSVQRPFVWSFMPIVNNDPRLQRDLLLQRYRDSAATFVLERQQEQAAEMRELDRLRKASEASLYRKRGASSRPPEPPLRLGLGSAGD